MDIKLFLILIFILFFHFVDMFFTVLTIRQIKNIYKNPEEIEINYHKYFMRWFGIEKGALISFILSCTFITITIQLIPIYSYFESLYFIMGMVFMMGYVSLIGYVKYIPIKEKLIKK